MISYTLKCDQDHRFESWFQSADAYEKLRATGMVCCATCGSSNVTKELMAPRVSTARSKSRLKTAANTEQEQAIAKVKAHVEANSDYVGANFASEARKMHLGDAPERSIHGEAKLEEARALIEDGIPVAPLPFTPTRKSN